MKIRSLSCALTSALICWAAVAEPATDRREGGAEGVLSGRVSANDSPLSRVGVYAYQLSELSLSKVLTDGQGRFSFNQLPAGLYKIIAYKRGFVPAVVLLTRATSGIYQFLDFELAEERAAAPADEGDFWAIRGRIPRDVLREIRLAEESEASPLANDGDALHSEMQAIAGFWDEAAAGEAQITGARMGLQGQIGTIDLDLSGRFREIGGAVESALAAQDSAISLTLRHRERSQLQLAAERASLGPSDREAELAQYRLAWSQAVGQRGRSRVSADYSSDDEFYRRGPVGGLALPSATRSWSLEGSFEADLEDHSVRTGISYQSQQGKGTLWPARVGDSAQRVEAFGSADWSVLPAVLVEYGLFTTLSDGSLSLVPHGGVVLDLGPRWTAEASVHQRLADRPTRGIWDFTPTHRDGKDPECGNGEEHCYRLELSHELSPEDSVRIGALHREFSESLRLYFGDDVFDQLESLLLVRGDELPELEFAIRRRLSDGVLAELRSHVGSGGGGVFQSTEAPYRNAVRYVGTSISTEFERTSTGLFLAFHRLEQELTPLDLATESPALLEIDRLRILLTQDLDALFPLGSEWAFLLDMQLSRGASPFDGLPSNELRRQVTGGLAVKF